MNTSQIVNFPVAADLSAYSHVAVKLTSTGINLCTSVTDRVIGTMVAGNNAPQVGQSAVGMACAVNLSYTNGLHYVTLGAGITTAIALGDELELDTTDGTYCKRVAGPAAAIAAEAAPSGSATGIIRAILLAQNVTSIGASVNVTQITSAVTGVTANGLSGTITTFLQSIAAGNEVQFVVTNSRVVVGDVPVLAIASGTVGGTTVATVSAVANGSFTVTLTNLHASVSETGTLLLNYAIIKTAL